jgi:hypothetical protein
MATRQKTNRFTVEQTVTWLALLGFVPFAFLTTLLLVDPGLIADGRAPLPGWRPASSSP